MDRKGYSKGQNTCIVLSLALVVAFFGCPLTISAKEQTGRRNADNVNTTSRLKISLGAYYVFLDGTARAREKVPGDPFPSSEMDDMDVADNFGIPSMLLYEATLDVNVGRGHHLAAGWIGARAKGEGETDYRTGFNDSDLFIDGETEGGVMLDLIQVEWYFHKNLPVNNDEFSFDLGAGAINMRTELSFTDDANEVYEVEVIYAPLVIFLLFNAEWRPSESWRFGMDLDASVYSEQSKQLTELPGEGRYLRAEISIAYAVNRYSSLIGAINYWDLMIAFNDVETNDNDHLADNKFDVRMAGAYFGIEINYP